MNKITLTMIWMLALLATTVAIVSLRHTNSPDAGPLEIFDLLMYGWVFLPSALLTITAHLVFRRRMPRPWSSTMLIASIVYALLYSAMFIQVAFFPGSSTDAVGLLVAPVVATGAAVFAGWIVHLVFQSGHHDNAA